MRKIDIIIKELCERKSQLITSFIAITLGITVIVGIKTVTFYSEKAVARELDNLGANVLVLPKSATVSDYYSADFADAEVPESYVDTITASGLQGVDNLSPKLTMPIRLKERRFILTGILPKSEFRSKPAWQTGGDIFTKPMGCGAVEVAGVKTGSDDSTLDKAAVRKEVIKDLGPSEAIVGFDAARLLALKKGSVVSVKNTDFTVIKVLPQTGTVDDSRIFAHLHTVQKMYGKGRVLSAIEIVGCCKEISNGLIAGLNKALPDARVVTVSQIASTQLKTNNMMSQFSLVFLVIIVLVGGVSIANYMFANVQERRKEIGTLIAIGMSPRQLLSIFYGKALILGAVGGVVGYVLGTVLAVWLGPRIAHIPVLPMPALLGWALLISVALSLLATAIPAKNAAGLDPAATLMEV
ncbi:MAG: ABC transporter permease [Armatimonadota bacterium]